MSLPRNMQWSLDEARHNAFVLYHHLCSRDDAARVYVDDKGFLQFDNRWWIVRKLSSPSGDTSRVAIDCVVLRTLRRILLRLESEDLYKKLNPDMIIPKNPKDKDVEWFSDGTTFEDSSLMVYQRELPWLNREEFGRKINASRFSCWTCGEEKNLSYKQRVSIRVFELTKIIELGRENYVLEYGRPHDYDSPIDENRLYKS
jgi:hypothetical protein